MNFTTGSWSGRQLQRLARYGQRRPQWRVGQRMETFEKIDELLQGLVGQFVWGGAGGSIPLSRWSLGSHIGLFMNPYKLAKVRARLSKKFLLVGGFRSRETYLCLCGIRSGRFPQRMWRSIGSQTRRLYVR